MDLLLTLMVFVIAFMVFGSLLFGILKLMKGNKHSDSYTTPARNKAFHLRVNKTHDYSFK